jgi:uncharacterized protein (TIGR03084 family)
VCATVAPFRRTNVSTTSDTVPCRTSCVDVASPRAVAGRPASGRRRAALRRSTSSVALGAAPLKPTTLATTRLAEHWAHGLDITTPLGIDFPDTDRLRHIAWLGHATLPYAFALAGETPGEVFCELLAPDGTMWHFGDLNAASTIHGPAGQFRRLGARRLRPEDTTLIGDGPCARTALAVLRNYAG